MAFCLRAMLKLDHLGVLFQELREQDCNVLMWFADCFLLHHIYILVCLPLPIYALVRKKSRHQIFNLLSWSKASVICDGFRAVEIDFPVIR